MTLDAKDKAWIESTIRRIVHGTEENAESLPVTILVTQGIEALKNHCRLKKEER